MLVRNLRQQRRSRNKVTWLCAELCCWFSEKETKERAKADILYSMSWLELSHRHFFDEEEDYKVNLIFATTTTTAFDIKTFFRHWQESQKDLLDLLFLDWFAVSPPTWSSVTFLIPGHFCKGLPDPFTSPISTSKTTDKMVKTFQAYLENCHRTYSCIHCRAHLANHDELISKSFQGSQGRAYLFNSVVNVGCGQAEERILLTGLHAVADIFCESCKTTLGWKYEHAFESSQKYKEGKFIIELAHMIKENGWETWVTMALLLYHVYWHLIVRSLNLSCNASWLKYWPNKTTKR